MGFELLADLAPQPECGAKLTTILCHTLNRFAASEELASALRLIPNYLREFVRPPLLWEGENWRQMVASLDLSAQAGAHILSIEGTGGKGLHDDALLNGDLAGPMFSMGILACRDMAQHWNMIVALTAKRQVLAAGDNDRGFGNTAMALTDTRHIPKAWVQLRVVAFSSPRRIVNVV